MEEDRYHADKRSAVQKHHQATDAHAAGSKCWRLVPHATDSYVYYCPPAMPTYKLQPTPHSYHTQIIKNPVVVLLAIRWPSFENCGFRPVYKQKEVEGSQEAPFQGEQPKIQTDGGLLGLQTLRALFALACCYA